jgi:protein gp37
MDVLRNIPAVVRFVSAEPLLEGIAQDINLDGFRWLIAGGESGHGPEYLWPGTKWQDEQEKGRRTMKLEWAMHLLEKCRESETVFYFKQVTAFRSGEDADALGCLYHDFPAALYPWYAEDELDADFRKTGKGTAAQGEESGGQLIFELE